MKPGLKIFVVLMVLLAAFWLAATGRPKPKFVLPPDYTQVLDEVADVDVWIGSLTTDPLGETLAFSGGTKEGRKLTLIDLKTLEKKVVPTTNEVSFVFGWSPDGRYLAFDQVPYQPEKLQKTTPVYFESWLTLYDRQTGKLRRLTEDTSVMETPFYWLPDGGYLICQRNLTNEVPVIYMGDLSVDKKKAVSIFVPDMAIISDTKLVYALKSDFFLMDIKPLSKTETRQDLNKATIQKISNFKTNGFNGVVWVRYNPAKSNFLFCARPKESEWRYLYQFDPTQQRLTQLSHEDTYNGQWLLDGTGFAYVVNTNNAFQLAIRSDDSALNTNLFDKGNVVLYKASSNGDKVYASAAIGAEPHGIWEYTITNRTLRKLTEGTDKLVATRIVNPKEFWLKSFDGVEIPCFLFPPGGEKGEVSTNKKSIFNILYSKKKHPLVLYVPPTTSQFQRTFDAQSQMFANSGFYYATVNYRGCDGYGAGYSKLYDPTNAAKDVLALYDVVMERYPDIDPKNVFLVTSSAGMDVVSELLALRPGLWKAVGMDKCFLPDEKRFAAARLPAMITIMGTQDPSFEQMQSFVAWAQTNHIDIKSVIHTNAGHITYSLSDRKDTLAQILDFFVGHIE